MSRTEGWRPHIWGWLAGPLKSPAAQQPDSSLTWLPTRPVHPALYTKMPLPCTSGIPLVRTWAPQLLPAPASRSRRSTCPVSRRLPPTCVTAGSGLLLVGSDVASACRSPAHDLPLAAGAVHAHPCSCCLLLHTPDTEAILRRASRHSGQTHQLPQVLRSVHAMLSIHRGSLQGQHLRGQFRQGTVEPGQLLRLSAAGVAREWRGSARHPVPHCTARRTLMKARQAWWAWPGTAASVCGIGRTCAQGWCVGGWDEVSTL